jgi:hypothetical protein
MRTLMLIWLSVTTGPNSDLELFFDVAWLLVSLLVLFSYVLIVKGLYYVSQDCNTSGKQIFHMLIDKKQSKCGKL